MALDKCCDIAVPRSANQVALPVAWDRTIFNRCRSFSDGYGILDLAESVPFQAGMPGTADRAFRSQVRPPLKATIACQTPITRGDGGLCAPLVTQPQAGARAGQ